MCETLADSRMVSYSPNKNTNQIESKNLHLTSHRGPLPLARIPATSSTPFTVSICIELLVNPRITSSSSCDESLLSCHPLPIQLVHPPELKVVVFLVPGRIWVHGGSSSSSELGVAAGVELISGGAGLTRTLLCVGWLPLLADSGLAVDTNPVLPDDGSANPPLKAARAASGKRRMGRTRGSHVARDFAIARIYKIFFAKLLY